MLALSRENQAVTDEQEEIYRRRQIQWMEATRMAVVVSEEQGEVDKFRQWKLDITPHRRLMKEGFALEDGKRIDLDSAFKKEEHAREPTCFDISKIDFERLRLEFERSAAKRSTVQALKQVIETRLSELLARNPLRTDLQRHYEEIVEEYNREKDRVTIENTFAALLKFVDDLNDEEGRAMREGLDEESLALFDLLLKPGLGKSDIQRIRKVAADLLATLKAEKLRIENWREKEATRDAVQVAIKDFLWTETTGLPAPAYTEEDVEVKTRDIYRHVHRVYPAIPSPFYVS